MTSEAVHESGTMWRGRAFLAGMLGLAGLGAFLLLVHNYGLNLLPYQRQILAPELLRADAAQPSFAYFYHFKEGVPDRVREMRSRLLVLEDGRPHSVRTTSLEEIRLVGGDRYAQSGERVIFSTFDNSDPRTNGRLYTIKWPVLYSNAVGRGSALVLLACLAGLWWLRPVPLSGRGPVLPGGFVRWSWWTALIVFAAGLYGSTGTLAPYGITFAPPYVDPATGHVYNQDHVHFRMLFDFVDGQPRETWDRALLLRRILYPVLAWPAMKLGGFEAGGVATNLVLNLAAFIACGHWIRKRMGDRAAMAGAWLLATYPGWAYWVGMPYQYALIVPGSLLLAIALAEMADQTSSKRVAAWSFLMGMAYLAYDFAPIYLPATAGLLLWRRRWLDAGVALTLGVLPLACWLLVLQHGFGQPLGNSNTSVYGAVITALLSPGAAGRWLAALPELWDTAAATFFGANFLFLPAAFLGARLVNRWTSRVRPTGAETAVLAATLLLFLVVNFAPEQGGWNMSGSWISRLYQPVFPVMVFFIARWWQALPSFSVAWQRRTLLAALAVCVAGNLLVMFGPIARNPLGVSSDLFFRFYTHSNGSHHVIYERNLQSQPKRTFGFGRPVGSEGK